MMVPPRSCARVLGLHRAGGGSGGNAVTPSAAHPLGGRGEASYVPGSGGGPVRSLLG